VDAQLQALLGRQLAGLQRLVQLLQQRAARLAQPVHWQALGLAQAAQWRLSAGGKPSTHP